jgi:ribosome-binding factor A
VSKQRRTFRVAERIQSVVANQLLRLSDPRFFLVTITHVVVSRDLKTARVYWVVSGDKTRIAEVKGAFDSAQGMIRGNIAKEIGMRVAPELRFFYDDTLDTQEAVNEIFERMKSDSEQ